MPSDVQVFVRFKEQCVFAGEELRCTITFKNVAEISEASTPGPRPTLHSPRASSNHLLTANLTNARTGRVYSATKSSNGSGPEERPRGRHVASYSLSTSNTPELRGPSPKNEASTAPMPPSSFRPAHKHQRSVSIISMGSQSVPNSPQEAVQKAATKPMGHRRSSTVQLADVVRRPPQSERQLSGDLRVFHPQGRRSPLSASHSPSSVGTDPISDFKFPAESNLNPKPEQLRPSQNSEHRRPSHHRAVSNTSRADSLRTSLDIYSGSNHSDETLASGHASMVSERPMRSRMPSELLRQHYKMGPTPARKPQAATLLMGYAQVGATFTLDPSLVEQTPFEDVKKKGFLGGQSGGGVVGVKKKQRPTSGLFGGFNFASIGESLESIMGGDTSSGVKEMKAVTNSRAIPLLSTPQSLLFVDLHLEPGDERSFTFSYKLPRGLPASYRGKAIKIAYNLTIGVQSSPGAQQQVADVRQVNVPFRVFPGVDSDGEILGHDLMQPHVILKDLATTKQINSSDDDSLTSLPSAQDLSVSNEKFLRFVDSLLDRNRRRQSSSSILMEPFPAQANAAGATSQRQAIQAIHRAVQLSNLLGASSQSSTSPNRFEIARGGERIAVVTLDRPLHRLGETITVVTEFSNSNSVCASLRATLESSEKVSPSLAVRSAATIARVTRKVYASRAENALFSDRVVFCPTIPVLVSPTFITSGVSLDWYIKLEFGMVKRNTSVLNDNEETKMVQSTRPSLMEELLNDEKGILEVAVESIDCDTFEVAIPVIVYGDIVNDGSSSVDNVNGIPI